MGMKIEMSLLNPDKFTEAIEITIQEAVYRSMISAVIAAKQNTFSDKLYTDRTNNLRSSIGFVIYKDGKLVSSYFSQSGTGIEDNGSTGIEVGFAEAEDEAKKNNTKGYICILVAGMGYARSVESKGYDVISGSWLHFEDMFKREFQVLQEQVAIKVIGNKNVSFDQWLSGLKPGEL